MGHLMKAHKKAIRAVAGSNLWTPAMAANVLLKEMPDPFIEMMVETVLASGTSQQERAEALCRLLGSFGVGSIVEGRLV
jgi:hypothetical protein